MNDNKLGKKWFILLLWACIISALVLLANFFIDYQFISWKDQLIRDTHLPSHYDWGQTLKKYQILSTSQFELLWESDVFIMDFGNDYEVPLIAFDNQVFFVGSQDPQGYPSLISLDLLTSRFEWLTENKGSISALTHNSKYIFVGNFNGNVVAYAIESGKLVWSKFLNPRLKVLFATDSALRVDYADSDDVILETNTGEVLNIEWVAEEVISETWTDFNAISNIAISNGIAYYLKGSAKLVALDINTGQILGEVLFTPSHIQDRWNRMFYVAVDEDIVVVSFGDSRQLFAFRFLPVE